MCAEKFHKSGLILPTPAPPPAPLEIVGQYFGLTDLGEGVTTIGELTQHLSALRRSDVICCASSVIEALSQGGSGTPRVQLELAKVLLEPALAEKVIAKARGMNKWAIFHKRQLWMMIQLASVVCREGTVGEDQTIVNQRLGRACLMTSDVLHQIESEQIREPSPDDDPIKWLIMLLVSHSEESNSHDLFGRGRSFWFDSLTDPGVQRAFSEIGIGKDFEELFSRHYNLSLHEFFFVSLCLYFQFLRAAEKRPISPLLLDASVTSDVFSETDKRKTLDILAVGADVFATRLLGTPRQSWATDSSALMRSPLIEVFPSKYACPDMSYFRQFFVEGIYWLLADAATKKRSQWQTFFGVVFEWYINQVISSFTVTSEHLVKTFFQSPKFQGTNDQVCDGLIHWTNLAAICEYKGTRLTSRQRAGVQLDETIKAIEGTIGSNDAGVGQLAKNITRILAGKRVAAGNVVIDLSAPRRLLPILVWYEEAAANHVVRDLLQEKFTARFLQLGGDRSRVGPLLLLTPTDLELFDRFAGSFGGERLMTEYATLVEQRPKDPFSNFKLFMETKFKGHRLPEGFISEKLRSVLDDAQATSQARLGDGDADVEDRKVAT